MNKELIVILAAMLETDYGLCSSMIRNSYHSCKGVICINCVGSLTTLTKKQNSNHYIRLIASIPV